MLPYEQKTQQSPGRGRSTAPQPVHAWNHWHASVGMGSVRACPHSGQVIVDSSVSGAFMAQSSRLETIEADSGRLRA